jgi:hypothetical protein
VYVPVLLLLHGSTVLEEPWPPRGFVAISFFTGWGC